MNNKYKKNLSTNELNYKIKHEELNELNLEKKLKSSTIKTMGKKTINTEKKILTKANTTLSFLIKQFKDNENKNFISKTKRITKYDPKKILTQNELIIDTRSEIKNGKNYNQSNRKKFSYDIFRNKKYQMYKISYK